jgi:hypothetical protein
MFTSPACRTSIGVACYRKCPPFVLTDTGYRIRGGEPALRPIKIQEPYFKHGAERIIECNRTAHYNSTKESMQSDTVYCNDGKWSRVTIECRSQLVSTMSVVMTRGLDRQAATCRCLRLLTTTTPPHYSRNVHHVAPMQRFATPRTCRGLTRHTGTLRLTLLSTTPIRGLSGPQPSILTDKNSQSRARQTSSTCGLKSR